MTSKNNKNPAHKAAKELSSDLKNLNLDSLTSEQIQELMEKLTADLNAHASAQDEIGDLENAPRPPWIHFS